MSGSRWSQFVRLVAGPVLRPVLASASRRLDRITLRGLADSLDSLLAPGERLQTFAREGKDDGQVWVISDHNVFVYEATGTATLPSADSDVWSMPLAEFQDLQEERSGRGRVRLTMMFSERETEVLFLSGVFWRADAADLSKALRSWTGDPR